ncbi:unnamed protein product [Meganyctiphanes norvegica]|uniref:Secreted protein n=1 Tax=Meganyctiphanes norvegica TaxID=48144 RepID=A0AAV2SS50_MEGNR
MLLILAVTLVSSAYFEATELMRLQSKSSIIMIKSIGPITVPCGTPDKTKAGEDSTPLADTCWVLSLKNSLIQTPTFPVIPSRFNLWHRMLWSTLSKAFAKSR